MTTNKPIAPDRDARGGRWRIPAVVAVVAAFLPVACDKFPGFKPRGTNPTQAGNPGVGVAVPGAPPPLARPQLPPGWVDFKHPECNLSIYCPEQPFPNEFYSRLPLNGPIVPGTAVSKSYETRGTPVSCFVRVSQFHSSFPVSARDVESCETLMMKNGLSHNVVWAGRPAVEVWGDAKLTPGQRIVSRRLWVGDRIYSATLYGIDGHPTDAEMIAFFGSFVLGE